MAKEKEPIATAAVPAEPEYDVREIARNAEALFGYHPDIATAALKTAGVDTCGLEKAKTIIKSFAERKVN